MKRRVCESQQLTNYNFTSHAINADTIENIGKMFAMWHTVVDKLSENHLFNKTTDCVNRSWRASGLLDCTYHKSQFVVDTNSSKIIATIILQLNSTSGKST